VVKEQEEHAFFNANKSVVLWIFSFCSSQPSVFLHAANAMSTADSQEQHEQDAALDTILPAAPPTDTIPLPEEASPIKQEMLVSATVIVVDGSQTSSDHDATSPPTSLRASVEALAIPSATEHVEDTLPSFLLSLREESRWTRARSMPLLDQPNRPLSVRTRSLSPILREHKHHRINTELEINVEADERLAGPSSRIVSLSPPCATEEGGPEDDREQVPSSTSRIETVQLLEWANRPPSPPQRNLRTRKPAQLAPYTTEMQRYKRRLVRNDWQDAVVIEKEFLRAQREKRREREENGLSPLPEDEAEKRQRLNAAKRRTSDGGGNRTREDRRRSSSRVLQDRVTNEMVARYGGPLSSSSENEEEIAGPSRLPTPSSSTSSQGARAPSRKRVHRALLSETESSSVEVHEISDDSTTQSDGSDAEQSFIVVDDENTLDRRGNKERLSAKEMRYYKQQLKLARRTMPMAAAKRCIDDLMLMHKERREGRIGHGTPDEAYPEEFAAVSQSPGTLRPGESRTRMVHQREEHSRLIDDADEESDDPNMPSPVSSDTEKEIEGRSGRSYMYDEEHQNDRWLHSVGRSKRDDIDRMLTSASRTSASGSRQRDRKTGSKARQTKLTLQGEGGPRKTYRKERIRKDDDFEGSNEKYGRSVVASSRKRKKRKGDLNTNIVRSYSGPSAGLKLLENPPIAQVRTKPRFSLLNDAMLFEGMPSLSPADAGQETPLSSSIATPSKNVPGHQLDWQQVGSDNETPASRASISPTKASRHDRRQPMGLSPGQRYVPTDLDRPAPAQSAAVPAPKVQRRIEIQPRTSTTATASPAHLKQRSQMDIWHEVGDLRLDFGIHPPPIGLSFHADTSLGKGRVFELLQLTKGTAEVLQPRQITVFSTNLTVDTFDGRELQDAFDIARLQLIPFLKGDGQSEGEARFPAALSDVFRFILLWLTAAQDETKARNVVRVARMHVEEIITTIKENKQSKGPHHATLLQALRWFKVELGWREACHQDIQTFQLDDEDTDWEASFVQSCQELMLELLIHGLHNTMHSIKRASEIRVNLDDPTGFFALDDAILTDQSAQYWIGLIHLLTLEEATQMLGPFNTFWTIFEAATKQYQSALAHTKSGLVVAENGWYSIMAICCLGYFSASTGASTSRTCLKGGHWPMVILSLSHVRLRADEQVEATMPRAALETRDSYIRLVLSRVLHLHTVWGWSYESCEATLGKLFALFDTHKLEDLPTESNHDFPEFLRIYDESRLLDAIQEGDTAFHIFIKILARAAFNLRKLDGMDETQAERNVARLLSRFSPLRTMTFNRDLQPTTLQRSALYNHYSIALVYLYLVPASHHQRLLQIQQYLSFSKADDKSQLVCIRAMMYAITVLQHHSIDIKEAITWFKGAFKMLLSRLEELHRVGASSGHLLKWEREIKTQKTLLIAALRSLQYAIKIESLQKEVTSHSYPSVLLIDVTWTASLLQSQLAIQSTVLTLEVFHLLQAFLARRISAIAMEKKKALPPRQNDQNAESQDSFADLFDDIDFDDALLLDAAGYKESDSTRYPTEAERQETIRQLDRDFALHLHSCISPAVFQLLSNLFHPARKPAFSMARKVPDQLHRQEPGYMSMLSSAIKEMSKTTLAETIIDTWALFAWIMVEETEVRQWSHYFNYGLEDPKRLQGEVAKRDVSLHFLLMISSKCLGQSNSGMPRLKVYKANLTDFWSCFMASFPSRNLTSQHQICNNLRQLEWKRDIEEGGLLRGMNWQDTSAWTVEDYERDRLVLLGVILTNFTASWQEPRLAPKSLLFASLTSLLVSVRIYIVEDKNGHDEDHLAFCKSVVQCCKDKLSETLLRGVAAELRKTTAFLE
jgi:hypothetical protein